MDCACAGVAMAMMHVLVASAATNNLFMLTPPA
jgi:hypothetical protein